MDTPTTRRTACTRDCPDACEIIATVADGRIMRLQGAKDHPVTQGFLCHRTSRFLDRQYAADRLTTPLLRKGDTFVPIDWDAALDMIAERMRRVCAESGPAAVMHYRCGGSLGMTKHLTDWFFHQLGGVTEKSGDVCSGAGEAAQVADFGVSDSSDLFDLLHSQTIVLWGKNPFVSNLHLLPVLREAKRRGARLVLVDPVQHRTKQICDLNLQVRPGGDAALACGVARWLFDHERHDVHAPTYCDHWDAYRDLIHRQTVSQWAAAAGVSAAELQQLAEWYATGPAAILVGWGMQRRTHGAATVRALDALAAMAGNLGIAGGGVSFYFQRRSAFDFSFAQSATPPARTIPEPQLGRGILAAQDPPVRLLYITAANPVAMLPDSHEVARALRSRELTVVVDSFLTDSARCAHLVLPTTTFLEEDDLVGAYGHHWIAAVNAIVPPPAGAKSDYEILQALAPRIGLQADFSAEVNHWRARLLQRVTDAGTSMNDLQRGAIKNPFAREVLFADRKFRTQSGRVQLVTQLHDELRSPPAHATLKLAALSTDRAQASQWSEARPAGPPALRIHPHAVPGALNGQVAQVRSQHGQLRVRLVLDSSVHCEVAVMDKGGWLSDDSCANALIPAQLTDHGEGAVYYDTEITIALAAQGELETHSPLSHVRDGDASAQTD